MTAPLDHRRKAISLLTSGVELRPREGQFLGGIAFDANPLTQKQARWLSILIEKHGHYAEPNAHRGDDE